MSNSKDRYGSDLSPWPAVKKWNAEEIRKICDAKFDYLTSQPNVNMFNPSRIPIFEMFSNGIEYHNLDFEALLAALSSLTKALLLPNKMVIESPDHAFLWAWCGELSLSLNSRLFGPEDVDIREHLRATLHAALSNWHHLNESNNLQRAESLLPHYKKLYIDDSNRILPYLTFPLLEAVLRRACSEYIDKDGLVIKDFTVPSPPWKKKSNSIPYTAGCRCSSIRDLLFLYKSKINNQNSILIMEEFMNCIKLQSPEKHAFDIIYGWRNRLLHGNESSTTVGGALLNLCFTIVLNDLRETFETFRDKIIHNIENRASGKREKWDYYPPF